MSWLRERRWLRPLGLFAIATALSVGQPSLVVIVAFAFLTTRTPGRGFFPILATAMALGLAFIGQPSGPLWYLERGWAILVGGWFVVVVSFLPASPFFIRALVAIAGSAVSMGLLLSYMGGLAAAEWFVAERVREGMEMTLRAVEGMSGAGEPGAVGEMIGTLWEVQVALLPAFMGLSALASLGVAWWMHQRLVTGASDALDGIRDFRFPDPMIWLLIAGIMLLLVSDWNMGWGRVGTNLVAFMGGLYIFRGTGVLLALAGRLTLFGGLALLAGLIFAGPFLLAAAMVVGVSDSWFDLRSRANRGEDGGTA